MTKRTSNTGDFENRYYDLIQDSIESLREEVRANTRVTEATHEQAKRTNGRVTKLEQEVFGKVKPSDLPAWYRDPKIISIIFNISLAILVLIIAATKVNVEGLIP